MRETDEHGLCAFCVDIAAAQNEMRQLYGDNWKTNYNHCCILWENNPHTSHIISSHDYKCNSSVRETLSGVTSFFPFPFLIAVALLLMFGNYFKSFCSFLFFFASWLVITFTEPDLADLALWYRPQDKNYHQISASRKKISVDLLKNSQTLKHHWIIFFLLSNVLMFIEDEMRGNCWATAAGRCASGAGTETETEMFPVLLGQRWTP